MRRTIPLILAPLLLANAQADEAPPEMPDTVKAMLDAAMKAGDEAAVNAIVKYAKAADKERAAQFESAAATWPSGMRRDTLRNVKRTATYTSSCTAAAIAPQSIMSQGCTLWTMAAASGSVKPSRAPERLSAGFRFEEEGDVDHSR